MGVDTATAQVGFGTYRCYSKGDEAVQSDGASCQGSKGRATFVGQNTSHQADLQKGGYHIEDLHMIAIGVKAHTQAQAGTCCALSQDIDSMI